MDTQEDTTATAQSAITVPGDGFLVIADLLRLVADPKAAAARLRSLHENREAIVKAKAELDAAQIAHNQQIAESKAKLAAQEKKIDEGWKLLTEAKAQWSARVESIESKIKEINAIEFAQNYETLSGGLTRRRDHTALPPDPHYGPRPPSRSRPMEILENGREE
jgi:hypothetical protein